MATDPRATDWIEEQLKRVDRMMREAELPPAPPPLPPADGSGDNGGMSDESRITALETKWETVIPTLVTKADLKDAVHDLAKWIVGSAIAIAVAGVTVMTFVLNNAVPKPVQPPTFVVVPAPTAPAASVPAPK